MQEFIDLISSSPEPELPKTQAKVAPIVAPKAPLRDLSQNIHRPPTVQLFDFSFANFDNATSIETAKAPPPNPSIRSPKPKASKIIPLDDGNELQLWSDDFDTTIGSIPNSASAKQDTGNSKQQQGDNAPIEIADSDDPFTSPPPAKRHKASPPTYQAPRAAGGYKRTVSNIESVRSSKARLPKYSLNRSNSLGADPLLFTSSPDASAARSKYGKGKVPSIGYDDDDEEDEVEIPRKKASKPIFLDVEDEDDFPSIENLKSWNPPPRRSKAIEEPMLHHYDDDSTPEKKKREKGDKSKEKTLSAAEKKAAKDAEREQKRIDKEYAKAEKEREKEKAKDLAKVNVDRTKPEISTPEMIVDLPSCIQDKSNMALRTRIDVLLKELDVQQSQWENSDLVIKWRRKVISEYNEESDIWEPKPRQIKDEKHILCIMPARKFVDMALGRGDVDLDTHVSILKSQFESCKLIYLIEGLTAWQNKNRNIKDRQYQAVVRSRIPEDEVASSSSNQRRKLTQADEYIENADSVIEDSLLKLEVIHKVQHRLSTNTQDSAKWVAQFTKHISTIPYLAQREALGLNFCMAGGQFKSGKDTTDTYIKMLEEIHHVTEKMAEGIVAEYPTPQALLQGFKENGSSALEGCRKLANKNGALTDTKIGKAISRRVYKIFMEEDPESFDI
ncbi:uncharacterized protein EAF01_010643 [Botrytis porri]|uniref:ERCC4 domain-containing protein n=1 Tax=Botrytis porri TaxID=87229 RepID=A0A4Z1KGI5_9HELO|nr:uncharacterized protein EAF01_010643 [Botrytis porri]KAF7890834.1 hypothetical protein EAF01_010643 [Botrytis porri]TGO84670.1 hypothetical protein BPOR_0479g00100 [Botrytis porri]